MRHTRWPDFKRMLQKWAIARGIKHRDKLAVRLAVKPETLYRWLYKGQMPSSESLAHLDKVTRRKSFSKLRTKK